MIIAKQYKSYYMYIKNANYFMRKMGFCMLITFWLMCTFVLVILNDLGQIFLYCNKKNQVNQDIVKYFDNMKNGD